MVTGHVQQQRFIQTALATKLIAESAAMKRLARQMCGGRKIPLNAIIAMAVNTLITENTIGSGEMTSLIPAAEWARSTGARGILILPLSCRSSHDNSDSMYSAISQEAIDPVYIDLRNYCPAVEKSSTAKEIMKKKVAKIAQLNASAKVDNVGTRQFKLEVLHAAFEDMLKAGKGTPLYREFEAFRASTAIEGAGDWLKEFSAFATLQNHFEGKFWREWPGEFLNPQSTETKTLLAKPEKQQEQLFLEFVQWVADKQYRTVMNKCKKIGISVQDDLPFLPSDNSAKVYFNQSFYDLELSSGAPPDAYATAGQKWGMFPRRYDKMYNNLALFSRALRVMQGRGTDGVRIDHIFGHINPYYIRQDDHLEGGAKQYSGWRKFNTQAEYMPAAQILLGEMASTGLELCAEALGVYLPGTRELLKQFHMATLAVARWERDWADQTNGQPYIDFTQMNPMSWICPSVHDTPLLASNYQDMINPSTKLGQPGYEQLQINDLLAQRPAVARLHGLTAYPKNISDELYQEALKILAMAAALTYACPIGDVLCLDSDIRSVADFLRINVPGTVNVAEVAAKLNWVNKYQAVQELFAGSTAAARSTTDTFRTMMQESGRFVPKIAA